MLDNLIGAPPCGVSGRNCWKCARVYALKFPHSYTAVPVGVKGSDPRHLPMQIQLRRHCSKHSAQRYNLLPPELTDESVQSSCLRHGLQAADQGRRVQVLASVPVNTGVAAGAGLGSGAGLSSGVLLIRTDSSD